ncbi:MAG: TetR/AcrR family transcriptional regulator [Corallococcus sp.]|nr:TetR/AcrR family transcriptional regulator [Bacillota bacterium]MCM1533096.1 TetR/AcrR family transcriptional regulator [Corallococcus sp.]
MNKFEIKFFNTEEKMKKALLRLIERKDFKDVTVSEICKEAGVNRTTFYLHFDNAYELLHKISDELVKVFIGSYKEQLTAKDLQNLPLEKLSFNTPEYLVPYLKFIRKNKFIYKVYMNNYGELNSDYSRVLREFFETVIERYGLQDKTVIYYMSKFYFSGVTAIVLEWVNGDCREEVEAICDVIALCTKR